MLFKLSISNIRRSLRDYAIYFFTLIIGVSVFYVFNAIGGQTAMMKLSENQYTIVELLETLLSGVSVFVAGVLGLLIVYASRFLMKRRNKEFALYMTLGMSKWKISAILLVETIIIGIGSLFVGLLIGIGLSQLMSALVASLFEADMNEYRFIVSASAIVKTIVYFAVMYVVVMICNSFIVTKMKLIDLMQSGKKSEQIKLKNPLLCVAVFLIAVGMLGYAYYQVGWNIDIIGEKDMVICIALGAVATFLIFWSVSGMLLRIVMSMKSVYHRSLNAFTFRQISSKINTMVFSMSVICLMLFVTICTLFSSFSIRNSLNSNLKEFCAADCELYATTDNVILEDCGNDATVEEYCEISNINLSEILSDYVHFSTYADPNFTFKEALGGFSEKAKNTFPNLAYDFKQELISVSDYNNICRFYGKDTITVEDGEFVLLCNYERQKDVYDDALALGEDITIFGNTLHPRYNTCQDGFINISAQAMNTGIFVVPDNVIDTNYGFVDHIVGNFKAASKEEKAAAESDLRSRYQSALSAWSDAHPDSEGYSFYIDTRTDLYESTIGLGALATFLGLYIGLVFLIACGAILALKELSESTDSIGRYEMLRKIGVEEKDISKSLFGQSGIFFIIPLLLACVHSLIGMRFSSMILESVGTKLNYASITATALIILLIYGGYFLITFTCSKNIIKERK